MAKYVVAEKVISVCIKGAVYEKKDGKVFDDQDPKWPKGAIEAAYKSGFLEKKEGNKTMTYAEEQKKKAVDSKKAVKAEEKTKPEAEKDEPKVDEKAKPEETKSGKK